MKQILIFLALISSVICASYAMAEETLLDSLPVAEFRDMRRMGQAEVADVLSPLTVLMVNGSIVRLSGVDVPDSYGDEASVLAVTARDIMKDLLAGQRVEVYQTSDKKIGLVNRMGHSLAHIKLTTGEVWAQGVLLKLGLARVKTRAETAHMAEEMLALEAAAREEKIGIWADDAYRVLSADEAGSGIGTFAIVEGRVESVAIKKNRIYINFGKDWRSDFTVSIAPADKRAFSKVGYDVLNWGGKVIRARGSLREYNGAYMDVTHPAAIEFIDVKEPPP